eukprot:1264793-Prymnesium_polylepis.1
MPGAAGKKHVSLYARPAARLRPPGRPSISSSSHCTLTFMPERGGGAIIFHPKPAGAHTSSPLF